MRRTDGRETWKTLLDWDKGQTPSERLAATLLGSDGFLNIDPSHPLGGKDGKKDALLKTKDGLVLVVAVYFPRGQQSFTEIKRKFKDDLYGINLAKLNLPKTFCKDRTYDGVYLWTFQGLDSARHLYEKYGFTLAEETVGKKWGTVVTEQRFDVKL